MEHSGTNSMLLISEDTLNEQVSLNLGHTMYFKASTKAIVHGSGTQHTHAHTYKMATRLNQ